MKNGKRFEVQVTQTWPTYTSVIIEAKNREEAEAIALWMYYDGKLDHADIWEAAKWNGDHVTAEVVAEIPGKKSRQRPKKERTR